MSSSCTSLMASVSLRRSILSLHCFGWHSCRQTTRATELHSHSHFRLAGRRSQRVVLVNFESFIFFCLHVGKNQITCKCSKGGLVWSTQNGRFHYIFRLTGHIKEEGGRGIRVWVFWATVVLWLCSTGRKEKEPNRGAIQCYLVSKSRNLEGSSVFYTQATVRQPE